MELWKCTQILKLIGQLIADLQRGRTCNSEIIRSCTSFLCGGQLSTDELDLKFVYIFIISFPVWTGIKINSSPNRKLNWNWLHPKQEIELKSIPARTGNGTMKMYTNCRINFSVDSWPLNRKDIQLLSYTLIRSCMTFFSGGQLSTDKLIL